MQISKKQGGWSKSHENKPIIKKEIFLNPIRKVICGRNLKGIGKPRSVGPAQFSLTMTIYFILMVMYFRFLLNI